MPSVNHDVGISHATYACLLGEGFFKNTIQILPWQQLQSLVDPNHIYEWV